MKIQPWAILEKVTIENGQSEKVASFSSFSYDFYWSAENIFRKWPGICFRHEKCLKLCPKTGVIFFQDSIILFPCIQFWERLKLLTNLSCNNKITNFCFLAESMSLNDVKLNILRNFFSKTLIFCLEFLRVFFNFDWWKLRFFFVI